MRQKLAQQDVSRVDLDTSVVAGKAQAQKHHQAYVKKRDEVRVAPNILRFCSAKNPIATLKLRFGC